METNTQQERAKRLEQQAREYLMQSNDPIFTRYLQQLLPRIQRQPEYVEQLQAELDKSVEFWYQRQQINANRGGETGAESSVPQQSVPQEAAAGEQQTAGQSQTQPVGQFTMQQVQAPVTQAPAQKKQNAEYLVATIALSVVGGIFILTALVLLGIL
jgi:DNA primase